MYYLLGLSILSAALNSVIIHKTQSGGKASVFRFNLLGSAVWCVLLFSINGGRIVYTPRILLWGIIYGVVQTLFIMFKTAAMSAGPVAVTTLVGNSSLLLSLLVSMLLWKERVNALQGFGVVLLILGIFLCTYKKSSHTYTKQWKIYTLLFLFFAAGVGVTFKVFSKSDISDFAGDMMFVSAIVMTFCYFVICLCTGGLKVQTALPAEKKSFLCAALLSGFLSCIYNRLNIYVSGNVDAIIFFPFFNGGVVILSAILSVLICRENLNARQKLGLLTGTAAILVIGIF